MLNKRCLELTEKVKTLTEENLALKREASQTKMKAALGGMNQAESGIVKSLQEQVKHL